MQVLTIGHVVKLGIANSKFTQQMESTWEIKGSQWLQWGFLQRGSKYNEWAKDNTTRCKQRVHCNYRVECEYLQQYVSNVVVAAETHRFYIYPAGNCRKIISDVPSPKIYIISHQHASQMRTEQNSLDLLFGLFNMSEQEQFEAAAAAAGTSTGPMVAAGASTTESGASAGGGAAATCESTASSLEILRILTLNMHGDDEYNDYNNTTDIGVGVRKEKSNCHKYAERFLELERVYLSQLIAKSYDYCPSVFGKFKNLVASKKLKLSWSWVGVPLLATRQTKKTSKQFSS